MFSECRLDGGKKWKPEGHLDANANANAVVRCVSSVSGEYFTSCGGRS